MTSINWIKFHLVNLNRRFCFFIILLYKNSEIFNEFFFLWCILKVSFFIISVFIANGEHMQYIHNKVFRILYCLYILLQRHAHFFWNIKLPHFSYTLTFYVFSMRLSSLTMKFSLNTSIFLFPSFNFKIFAWEFKLLIVLFKTKWRIRSKKDKHLFKMLLLLLKHFLK